MHLKYRPVSVTVGLLLICVGSWHVGLPIDRRGTYRHATPLMALHWVIDSRNRLVVATAEEGFTFKETLDYLRVIVGAGALDYRQLLDISQADARMSPDEAMELGVHFRTYQARSVAGPLAIIMPDRPSDLMARLLGILATAPRPMRLFASRDAAVKWLGDLAAPVPDRSILGVNHDGPERATCR